MASYLQADNLTKSYGPRVLFKNLSFNINEGDKIALIAPSGTGKTSLLNILAGKDSSDGEGKISFMKDIKVSFLEQESLFPEQKTLFEIVQDSVDNSNMAHHVEEYEIKKVLTSLKLNDMKKRPCELSGGEAKRLAIACSLISKPDFLVMDEPTNHLDLDIIEFLEEYLTRSKCTLFMVTHDRYFLDRVCNKIMEMADGTLYTYNGNYSYFLEKREERMENLKANIDRARNLYRTELDWMQRMPCARGTKAKYRKDAFQEIKTQAFQRIEEKNLNIDVRMSRLGRKIINCKHVEYRYKDWLGLKDFTYNFAQGEKVGIVGNNGVGKTTFLKLLIGELTPTAGEIERGETLVTGYYKQSGMEFNPNDTVIDAVREIAEVVTMSDGKQASVATFLNYFLFPPSTHYTKIEKLSGGERRRLYLCTVLMKNPNFLILDEPTNDLDILTLNVLEEYLINFKGSVIIVSHDRYFMDKIADHLFIFEGNGVVKDFVGQYSGYRQYIKDKEIEKQRAERQQKEAEARKAALETPRQVAGKPKNRLSYKEQREYEALETEIDKLEKEKAALEAELSSGTLTPEQLNEKSVRIGQVITQLDTKSERWLELAEYV